MILKEELNYALLLTNGDLEFAYQILDFVANNKRIKEKKE